MKMIALAALPLGLAACAAHEPTPLTASWHGDKDLCFNSVERTERLAYAWNHTHPDPRPNPALNPPVPVFTPAIDFTDPLRRDARDFSMLLQLQPDQTFTLTTFYALADARYTSTARGAWERDGAKVTLNGRSDPAPTLPPLRSAGPDTGPFSMTLWFQADGELDTRCGSIALVGDRIDDMRFYKAQ